MKNDIIDILFALILHFESTIYTCSSNTVLYYAIQHRYFGTVIIFASRLHYTTMLLCEREANTMNI